MNVFIVSSPFQYMFAIIIAKHIFPKESNLALYYEYQQNFRKVFKQISSLLDYQLSIEDLYGFKNFKDTKKLFISNRYNRNEIKIALQAKKNNIDICLFEDGLNMYLTHQFLNSSKNDSNKSLRFSNFLSKVSGSLVSHIYHSDIRYYYSFLDKLPIKVPEKNHCVLNGYFKKEASKKPEVHLEENSCVILSQWFVREDYIQEADYMEYLHGLVSNLKDKYSTVYYKSHPRDFVTFSYWVHHELGANQLPKEYRDIPVELLLLKTKTDVYGFGSATILYAKNFLHCHSYTLISDINRKYKNEKLNDWCNISLELLKNHGIKEYFFD